MPQRVSAVLAGVTAVLASAAAISGYARSELVDQDAFGQRVASALEDEDVRTVIGARVVDRVAQNVTPEVLAVRPLVSSAVGALAGAPAFQRVFARALSSAHGSLVAGQSRFVLDLDIGDGLVRESIRSVSPRAADAIPPTVELKVIELSPGNFVVRAARASRDLADWWWTLVIATLLSGAACAALAGGARRAITRLGTAAAVAGLLVAALVTALGLFVVSRAAGATGLEDETERAAVGALWDALFADLRTTALLVALAGVVVTAFAAGSLTRDRLTAAGGDVRRLARSPARAARMGRAVILVAVGAGLLLEPGLTAQALLAAAGVVLVLMGVAELAGRTPRESPAEAPGTRTALVVTVTVGVVLALAVVAVALVLPAPPAVSVDSVRPGPGCNGSPALCDRRLNEVVFPATHNSYAASDEPGWFFANQRYGIARQLRDGIRAFLIDIHYGAPDPESGVVRTDLRAEGSSRNKVKKELSPQALRAADRLVGRAGVGRPTGERRAYLCHTLCELGSEALDEQFELFRRFLAANPNEVVILFIEPYVPVGEIERALDRTGLLSQAAELDRDQPLPTLGQLILEKTRLVVMTEEGGGARPWYLDGFSFVQDTPLGATRPSQFRCRRYRGNADSPVYLVNHWIPPFPPSVRRNERIGGGFLRRRLSHCERRRGLLPNLVAVDFHERSGVVEVTDALNARGR
jgi:amino acid transporter